MTSLWSVAGAYRSGREPKVPEVLAMHRIAVVAVTPLNAFDLSIPGLIFGGVEVDGRPAYDVRVCTARPGVLATTTGLDVYIRDGLEAADEAETVMVTGGAGRGDVPAV